MAEKVEGKVTADELHEREVDGAGRELAAALARLEEVKAMPAALPQAIKDAELRVENARAEAKRLGQGQKSASKRPRSSGKKETR